MAIYGPKGALALKKQKTYMKIIPAMLMSAFIFESMTGSVAVYHTDEAGKLVGTAYNFFVPVPEYSAAFCLPLAGLLTFVGMVLSIYALCAKKPGMMPAVCWLTLAAAALATLPFMIPSEALSVRPQVVIAILLMAVWGLCFALRHAEGKEQDAPPEVRRLSA